VDRGGGGIRSHTRRLKRNGGTVGGERGTSVKVEVRAVERKDSSMGCGGERISRATDVEKERTYMRNGEDVLLRGEEKAGTGKKSLKQSCSFVKVLLPDLSLEVAKGS